MKTDSIWTIVLSILFSIWLIFYSTSMLTDIFKSLITYSRSVNPLMIFLRKRFWTHAKKKLLKFIDDQYYSRSSYTHCVVAIVYYEITHVDKIKETFINHGYVYAQLLVSSKLDKISIFVKTWKEDNEYLTAENLVQLYLNETRKVK